MGTIKLKQIIREEVRKTLNEGAITKAIRPALEGELKVAVQALETMLANQLTTAGLARNASELADLVIDIIDAAKQEERVEISQSESVVKEASGQLTTYLEPKQHQALVNVVSSVDELMQSIDDAARVVHHKDIRKWLVLSKRELVQIQSRLKQIDLRK